MSRDRGNLRARIERLAASVTIALPVRHALAAFERGHWLDAVDRLDGVHRRLRKEHDTALRDTLREAWFVAALCLAEHSGAPLLRVASAIAELPPDERPPRLASARGLADLADEVLAKHGARPLARVVDALPHLLPDDSTRAYLAGRILEAADGHAPDAATQRRAHDAFREAERPTDAARSVQNAARIRRATSALAQGDAARARATLDAVRDEDLDPAQSLRVARVFIDSPRPMQRVRALDVLARMTGALRAEARALVDHRLARIGPRVGILELDRLRHAVDVLFPERLARRAQRHLDALVNGGTARSTTPAEELDADPVEAALGAPRGEDLRPLLSWLLVRLDDEAPLTPRERRAVMRWVAAAPAPRSGRIVIARLLHRSDPGLAGHAALGALLDAVDASHSRKVVALRARLYPEVAGALAAHVERGLDEPGRRAARALVLDAVRDAILGPSDEDPAAAANLLEAMRRCAGWPAAA